MERKSVPTELERKARERIQKLVNDYCSGSQQELSNRTGVAKASISQYVNGKNVPSNFTAEKLGRPFRISPAWLMGFDVPMIEEPQPTYYLDSKTAEMAQAYVENREMRLLFDAARNAKPEDIKLAAEMLSRMKETNSDG